MSIGLVFLWFGLLKFFPDVSPAEPLASDTLRKLTFDAIPATTLLRLLATMECAIGACFVSGALPAFAVPLLLCHMSGTALPFLFFSTQLFVSFPLVPSFEGQYIAKNLIIFSAALMVRRPWIEQVERSRRSAHAAGRLCHTDTVDDLAVTRPSSPST